MVGETDTDETALQNLACVNRVTGGGPTTACSRICKSVAGGQNGEAIRNDFFFCKALVEERRIHRLPLLITDG